MANGMDYEDVRTRVKRINSNGSISSQQKSNLTNSLLNQARRRDGEGAERELRRELSYRSR